MKQSEGREMYLIKIMCQFILILSCFLYLFMVYAVMIKSGNYLSLSTSTYKKWENIFLF